MKSRLRTHNPQLGLSLVELMVAIAIGLFLLAGAVTIFINSKRTYVEQEDTSRIQEALRFAMDTVARDVRMSGYFGCGYSIDRTKLNNTLAATAGTLRDTDEGPLAGLEGSAGTISWLPSGNTTDVTASVRGGTDGVTVRHAGGPTWEVTGDFSATEAVDVNNVSTKYTGGTTYNADNENVIFGGEGEALQQNDIAVVGGCGTVEIFLAGATTTGSGGTIAHGTSFVSSYDSSARVSKATFVRYYIANDAGGEPGLYRQWWNRATPAVETQLLVPGIENMQITYGVDDNDDNLIDRFVVAGTASVTDNQVGSWVNVIAVRIGLLARSATNNAFETDSQSYVLNGTTLAAANDKRRRRMLEATVFVRNNSVTLDES